MDVVRFPLLRVNNSLVVKPEIVGPNFKEFTNLYNQIFGIGKYAIWNEIAS